MPRGLSLAGLLLVVAYVAQAVTGAPTPIAEVTRDGLIFRTVTGTLLLALLCAQMYVPLLRFSRRFSEARKRMAVHEYLGVLGPILLYIHAPHPRPGYLSVLAAVMLANTVFGLLTSATRRSRWHQTSRMLYLSVHIASASFLVVLALFHVGHALYYD